MLIINQTRFSFAGPVMIDDCNSGEVLAGLHTKARNQIPETHAIPPGRPKTWWSGGNPQRNGSSVMVSNIFKHLQRFQSHTPRSPRSPKMFLSTCPAAG